MWIKNSTYKIIRVNGEEELIEEKPSLSKIRAISGCDTLDTVILTYKRGEPEIIMPVDDIGMLCRKPVNPKATELYRAVCKPGTPFSIHGDVAIVNDKDF
jgi:hypothetical protein